MKQQHQQDKPELPRTLTPAQERRLRTANIVAEGRDSDRTFKWWLNAHTGNTYRGHWENAFGHSGEIIDADTIDELFDIGLARYEGRTAIEFFAEFEERNYKLCLLKIFCEKNLKYFSQINERDFFVHRCLEGYIRSDNDMLAAKFTYSAGSGDFAVWSSRMNYSTHSVKYYMDMIEVANGVIMVANKIKQLGMPFVDARA